MSEDKIISLDAYRKKAFLAGSVVCACCKHEWIATAPAGTLELVCPQCETQRGHWKYAFAPRNYQLRFRCSCGNELFYITPEGWLCPDCGTCSYSPPIA